MNQAHKEARKNSEKYGAQFVVHVFDDGEHIYEADQVRRWKNFLHVEACYMEGRQVPEAVYAPLIREAA
jgi:hypothetical protein